VWVRDVLIVRVVCACSRQHAYRFVRSGGCESDTYDALAFLPCLPTQLGEVFAADMPTVDPFAEVAAAIASYYDCAGRGET
jgi:hypothetical protein